MSNKKKSYGEVLNEMESLKGFKITNKIKHLSRTNYIFTRNFLDLKKAIESYESNLEIWSVENRPKLEAFMTEVIRLLHNYAVSVLTLIDHTRNFRRKIKEKRLDKIFDEEIEKLRLNEVIDFMKDLRQYIQHHTLPFIQARLSFKKIEGTKNRAIMDQKLLLDKKELFKWGKWSSNSKRYISKFKGDLDLKSLCEEYYKLIKNFYNFFYTKVIESYSKEIKELHEFKKNLIKLYPPPEEKIKGVGS